MRNDDIGSITILIGIDLSTPGAVFFSVLGDNGEARQAAYRKLFRHRLAPGTVAEIRAATNGNFVLGSTRFQAQVAAALGRRVTRARAGRPQKRKEAE